MKFGSWIAVYFICWWVSLFVALPFAIRRDAGAAEVVDGADPGAPVRPRALRVLAIATALGAVLTGLIWWASENAVL
jgi:predicted secreted protein